MRNELIKTYNLDVSVDPKGCGLIRGKAIVIRLSKSMCSIFQPRNLETRIWETTIACNILTLLSKNHQGQGHVVAIEKRVYVIRPMCLY